MSDCKIEYTSRDIIGHRLLVELANDNEKVALLLDKPDLDVVIEALDCALLFSAKGTIPNRWTTMLSDLRQLRKGAFGQ